MCSANISIKKDNNNVSYNKSLIFFLQRKERPVGSYVFVARSEVGSGLHIRHDEQEAWVLQLLLLEGLGHLPFALPHPLVYHYFGHRGFLHYC